MSDGNSRRPLPEHVTLPLLTLITKQSLDEDYSHVAERRARGHVPVRRSGRLRPTSAAVAALFGLLIVTAAVQTSRDAGVNETGRATLVAQVQERRADLTAVQTEIGELRDQNVTLAARLDDLGSTEQTERNRLRRLEVRTGFTAVKGPGVLITADDAPDGDATQMIRDEDLALLVNGLWRAGAEAIAINDQRLTVLTSIRNRGPAIQVNRSPVPAPYTIAAIGDPQTLQADLANTTHGLAWFNLVRQLGFVTTMQNEDSLSLPGARTPRLRSAKQGSSSNRVTSPEQEAIS